MMLIAYIAPLPPKGARQMELSRSADYPQEGPLRTRRTRDHRKEEEKEETTVRKGCTPTYTEKEEVLLSGDRSPQTSGASRTTLKKEKGVQNEPRTVRYDRYKQRLATT